LAVRHSVEFMPGSLGWAIEKFLSSPLFNEKAENTKRGYRRILDQLRQSYGARDGHNDWNGLHPAIRFTSVSSSAWRRSDARRQARSRSQARA
jgi:hypothetical protein